jgi:DNA-binding transcriptional MocR family regulator
MCASTRFDFWPAAALALTFNFVLPRQAGQPGPSLIPLDEIQAALDRVMEPPSGNPLMLQYRTPKEFMDCRQNVATLLSESHGIAVSAEDIAITSGNSAALGMLFSNIRIRRHSRQDVASGSTYLPSAIVEHPTYFLARDMLLDAGVVGRGCEVDSQGIRVDLLRQMCEADGPPDFVYLNPNFHNPTGAVLSKQRRQELVSLAVEFDFLVLSDEPYNLLSFGAAPPLPLASEPGASKHVLSLGSFSKILAPGLRIGWIQGDRDLLERAWWSSGVIRSGGALNPVGVSQNQLADLFESDVSILNAIMRLC